MKTVAITGSISCGKSTLLREIARHNIPVFNCDEEISKLYQNSDIINQIKKIVPESYKSGKIIKEVLLEKILQNIVILKKLQAILYPHLNKQKQKFITTHRRKGFKLVFFEVPLLFENRLLHQYDAILFIHSTRRKRERNFRKKSNNIAVFRVFNACQFSDAKKLSLACRTPNAVILRVNNIKDLPQKVSFLLKNIL